MSASISRQMGSRKHGDSLISSFSTFGRGSFDDPFQRSKNRNQHIEEEKVAKIIENIKKDSGGSGCGGNVIVLGIKNDEKRESSQQGYGGQMRGSTVKAKKNKVSISCAHKSRSDFTVVQTTSNQKVYTPINSLSPNTCSNRNGKRISRVKRVNQTM